MYPPYNLPHFWNFFQKQIPLQFYIIYFVFPETINGSSIPTFIFGSLALGEEGLWISYHNIMISGMGITSPHLLKLCTEPRGCDKHEHAQNIS